MHRTWMGIALTAVFAVGCGSSPAAPSSASTPAPSPRTGSIGLNTVFLAAPPAPARSATNPLVGRYQLEISVDGRSGQQCDSIPGSAMRRTFTADIDEAGAYSAVRLYDATFLADAQHVGYGCADPRVPQSGPAACHQFLVKGDPNALNLIFQAADDLRGSEIWEMLPDGFLLAITGNASGAMRDGRIEAVGAGSLWYGNGLPASEYYSCRSDSLRFTFTPR